MHIVVLSALSRQRNASAETVKKKQPRDERDFPNENWTNFDKAFTRSYNNVNRQNLLPEMFNQNNWKNKLCKKKTFGWKPKKKKN